MPKLIFKTLKQYSIDEIEKATGYDFFSTIPDQIVRKIESKDYTAVIKP